MSEKESYWALMSGFFCHSGVVLFWRMFEISPKPALEHLLVQKNNSHRAANNQNVNLISQLYASLDNSVRERNI